jgi:hypothetical protein
MSEMDYYQYQEVHMSKLTHSTVSEEQLKELSIEECVELRRTLQSELQMLLESNPGKIQRLITSINERLFQQNYIAGTPFYEAYEG